MPAKITKTVNKYTQVNFPQVRIQDAFWAPKLSVHQLATLDACLARCRETGRIDNFAKAAGKIKGVFRGTFFDDSDVYKLLEGIGYSLINHPDSELERQADEIINLIAAAQEADGYLLCYFTLEAPDKKWTDMDKHEMYCGGHLMEAAIAYHQATGKRKLLGVAMKLADHYDAIFGPSKRHWVPGHEEIELALVKLYRETGEERYWKLALWLLEERGHGHGVGSSWDKEGWGSAYSQDDKPIRELTRVTGHAVRAMYLYTAMTDVAAMTGDSGYLEALDKLWDNVVLKNMYLTGGIGQSKDNEGFTHDYHLPNQSAYAETCAAVGMVLWNHRMNLLHGDSRYADIVERAMYNGALSGVSLKGDKFFYVNPLESDGSHHRTEWFKTSCCPTQIARFLPSIGNYVYALSNTGIVVNQYMSGTGHLEVGGQSMSITQETLYPWEGRVVLGIHPDNASTFSIKLRVPGWCRNVSVQLNGMYFAVSDLKQGYIEITRTWTAGDVITLDLSMPVELVKSHPNVEENQDAVALQRGPIVYCLEEVDNPRSVDSYQVSSTTQFMVTYLPDVLGGITAIDGLHPEHGRLFRAIPYFAWDNREAGWMRVWVADARQDGDISRLYRRG